MTTMTKTSLVVLRLILFGGLIVQGLGSAQSADTVDQELAAGIFSRLGVRVVRCPAYTFEGGNTPVCGVTSMTPQTYTKAFDEVAKGRLEPQGDWDEDHTIWLRHYTAEGTAYAAIYSEIARGFNVQLVRLR